MFGLGAKSAKYFCLGGLLVILAVFIVTGMQGIDFGFQFDEPFYMNTAAESVGNYTFLPQSYPYPSMGYALVLLSLAPEIVKDFPLFLQGDASLGGRLQNFIRTNQSFTLRCRVVFLILSALAVLWTYGLVLVWRGNHIEALLAAGFLGFSWEVAYHSRWVNPNTLLMQFGILAVFLLFVSKRSPKPLRWLKLAAISTGLAAGMKYQGAFLMLPVTLGLWFAMRNLNENKISPFSFLEILFLSLLTYLLTTPGTVLQPTRFMDAMRSINGCYGGAGHGGYFVHPGFEHFNLLLRYFCFVVFSKYAPVAAVVFFLSLTGLLSLLLGKGRKRAAVFLSFPVFYFIFMGMTCNMVVRNMMILVPFFSILAARGAVIIHNRFLKTKVLRAIFILAIVGIFFTNSTWLYNAARSIQNRKIDNYVAQLASYIDKHAGSKFLLSKDIGEALQKYDGKVRTNISREYSEDIPYAVLFAHEVPNEKWMTWIANQRDYSVIWFGPYEVNFNYYPSWFGDDRIVVMPVRWAMKGIDVFRKSEKF